MHKIDFILYFALKNYLLELHIEFVNPHVEKMYYLYKEWLVVILVDIDKVDIASVIYSLFFYIKCP